MNFLDTKEMKSSTVIDYDLICKNSSTWCLVVLVLALNGRDTVILKKIRWCAYCRESVVGFHIMAS